MSTSPSVIRRFVEYYAGLDAQPPAALAALYHPDATLSDPFGQHQGLFAIQRYFTHLLANVEQCRFTIDTPLCDGQRFAVTWTMHWSHPRIAGGETLALPGCS
ncbi:nuclear transport factor 2 family protein, partial [Klebsiella grimontii]